jgi:hypothetical protein
MLHRLLHDALDVVHCSVHELWDVHSPVGGFGIVNVNIDRQAVVSVFIDMGEMALGIGRTTLGRRY